MYSNIEGIEKRDTPDIGAKTLGDVDRARAVFNNLKGSMKGAMKTKIHMTKLAVKVLVDRAAGGETSHWRDVALEQRKEIEDLKSELIKLKAQVLQNYKRIRNRRLIPRLGRNDRD